MENLGYLFAAYTVIWIAVFGYVFSLSRRHRKLQRDIDVIKMSMNRGKEVGD